MRLVDQVVAATRRRRVHALLRTAIPTLFVVGIAACADSPTSVPADPVSPSLSRGDGRGPFQRYVALGTGISMGWRSDGVTAQSQYDSWPAQLARIARREIDQPYLASPTCFPPIVAPFGAFTRESSGPCANAPGVSLPTENLAMRGATVSSALNALIGGAVSFDTGFGFSSFMPFVLPSGVTQVGAVAALRPRVISVEYGISEMLRALMTPVPNGAIQWPISATAWWTKYDQILDAISAPGSFVVLALPSRTLPPGFVSAYSLVGALQSSYAQAAFNVAPPPLPCEANRIVYAPAYMRQTIGEALAARARGEGPVTIDCNRLFRPDLSFSPDSYDFVSTAINAIRVHIAQQAVARGFATFDLEPLYTSYTQPQFDAFTFLESNEPFGPYVSLDGIYPSAAGNALLAELAARALNDRYGLALPVASTARLGR